MREINPHGCPGHIRLRCCPFTYHKLVQQTVDDLRLIQLNPVPGACHHPWGNPSPRRCRLNG